MAQWTPKSLRSRMIILTVIIVNIPIMVAGYMMKLSAEESLLEEKRSKLSIVAYLLDRRLGADDFDGILSRYDMTRSDRETQIMVLNRYLAAVTDEIASSSQGMGAGFYSRDLDAILTYGPSASYGYTVGWSIPSDHPGRDVMARNEYRVQSGTLVRGNIMNAMRPLERNDKVIGYIFVNELTDDVQAQLAAMDRGISFSIAIGMLVGFVLIFRLTDGIVRDVQRIVEGIRRMKFDLTRPISGLKGELDEIAVSINEMAATLDRAKRAERLATLGELMAGVAHEIRNPLTGIKGFLQYFQQAGSEEERQKYLPMILREVERMNRIIETLLYFARPYRGTVSPVDLRKIINDCILLVQGRDDSRQIVFTVEIDSNLPMVDLDEEHLEQVCLNLLINAVQAIDGALGAITVQAKLSDDEQQIDIQIADTGSGIPPDIRSKVMDPFFTTKPAGTGLGLAVVNRFVTAQGGSIVLSDRPGGGTVIRLLLPHGASKEVIV